VLFAKTVVSATIADSKGTESEPAERGWFSFTPRDNKSTCPIPPAGTFALCGVFMKSSEYPLRSQQSRAAARALLERRFISPEKLTLILFAGSYRTEPRMGEWRESNPLSCAN
jgi:hypothetical protein